jgi:pimeloyl-ACP methyl ester carboxylesterase
MATFVLVHGAWRGADGFRLVRPLLQSAGHAVFTPSLTGIGERAHLASPLVNLTTHVRDVVNTVLYEDLRQIVLLGYSYGGFVVTGAVEHVGDRVDHLVYLDAFVPDDGETAFGKAGLPTPLSFTLGDEWLVPGPERDYDDPVEAEFAGQRRTAHPIGCFTEPARVPRPLEEYAFSRTYIKATAADDGPGASAFREAAERARQSSSWSCRELDTNHMVTSNRPAELVELLLELVRGGGRRDGRSSQP